VQIVQRPIFNDISAVVESEEVIVITGCRQTGKTTTLRYFFEKIDSSNKLFLDLENTLNRKYFEETDYEEIKRAFEFQGLDFSRKAYVFLDEVQYARNVPSVVKYLKDHYAVKFFLTGSASFYLKNLFSESLSGRKYVFEILPLTFEEFLKFKGYHPEKLTSSTSPVEGLLDRLFGEYMRFGSFPGVVLKENLEEKEKKIKDIFSSYFEMEIEKLGDFVKLNKVRDLLFLVLQRSTSFIDISKISQEMGLSRHTVKEYISFFKQTYFIDLIKPFTTNRDVEIRKMLKVYPVDVGLARAFGLADEGKLFEMAVYQNLRRRGEVRYYRRKSGAEIDFILNAKQAFEAKVFASEYDRRRVREIAEPLNLREATVIALKKSEISDVVWAPYFCLGQNK